MINEIGKVISLNNTKKTLRLCAFALIFTCFAFGVEVVKNDEVLKGENKFAIELEKRTVLEPEDGDLIISSISSIAIDDNGNVFMMDSKEKKFYKFNKNGEFLGSFGKKGQGPGEFQYPIQIEVLNDGKLIVPDQGLSLFSNDGKFIKKETYARNKIIDNIYILNDGTVLISIMTFENTKKGFFAKKVLEFLNDEFKFAKKVFETSVSMEGSDEERDKALGFRIAAFSKNQICKQDFGNENLELKVFNENGKVIKVIYKKYKKIRKSKAQIQKDKVRFEEQVKNVKPKPEFKPVLFKNSIKSLVFDDLGNLWVKTIGENSKDKTYYFDVFDKKGKYVARIKTGLSFWKYKIKNGYLYLIEDNEDDGYCLYKYKVIEK